MPFAQKLHGRRACRGLTIEKLVQIDFVSLPRRPHRRWRLADTNIRVGAAQRIGVPAFGTARMENEVVKIPKNEIVVALGRAKTLVAGCADLEKNVGVDEEAESFGPREPGLQAQVSDLLRRGQHGQRGGNFRIASPEQRASPWRFQDYVVGAPPQIREARQHEYISIAQ